MLLGYLHMIFGEMSEVFCSFKRVGHLIFCVELYEFFMYSNYQFIIRYMISKDFFPFYRFPFHCTDFVP
jgi:hypothetical protein